MNGTITVTLPTAEQAAWVAARPELAGNGRDVTIEGPTLYLGPDAVAALAELDEHDDGHVDYAGLCLWLGGTAYPLVGVDVFDEQRAIAAADPDDPWPAL